MSSPLRRFGVALFAIAIAAGLLRSQLSSALVTRGDSLAYWGHRDAARAAYAKALFLDPNNGVAADRYAFNAATSGNGRVLVDCISIASQYLAENPKDSAVLMDRALCYQHQRLLAPAIADFRRAGEAARDARAFMFAALDERALHRPAAARLLLQRAVAVNPTFLPAQHELARL